MARLGPESAGSGADLVHPPERVEAVGDGAVGRIREPGQPAERVILIRESKGSPADGARLRRHAPMLVVGVGDEARLDVRGVGLGDRGEPPDAVRRGVVDVLLLRVVVEGDERDAVQRVARVTRGSASSRPASLGRGPRTAGDFMPVLVG